VKSHRHSAGRWSAAVISLLGVGGVALADDARLPNGKPDFSGTYNIATVTPLQRPEAFGNNLYLSPEQAEKLVAMDAAREVEDAKISDPNRGAPPAGGDGSTGAAGNVGGYNAFWIDNGDSAFMIDGRFRTSIITTPENGRRPELTPAGKRRAAKFYSLFRENTGEAWWVGMDGPGPFDGPESRTLSDRCLLGFGSTGGPPMLPVLYNNLKRIVQTPDHVMILIEMVHDARIVRMNSEHAPPEVRRWLGDSIGWWEGDTLVVETTNFTESPALSMATEALEVTERFRRTDDGTLLYSFMVEDPNTWTQPWGGEYPWPASADRVYEYACHEGNYAMEGMLKGARILEAEALEASSGEGS
jgi:hypothetical protein